MKKIILLIFILGCSTEQPTSIEPPVVSESDILTQIKESSYPDNPFNLKVSANDDSIVSFSTWREFYYAGETIPVSIVRGLSVWRVTEFGEENYGTNVGYIADKQTGNEVTHLNPDRWYLYIVDWNMGGFPIGGAFFTNFYIIDGEVSANKYIGKSLMEEIK